MITSQTSFLALIGNPVSHSLSPIMQNAALKYLGLDLIYLAIPCEEEDLKIVINSLKKVNCKGLNITIPHKQKVLDLCGEVLPVAEQIKAVNTLKLNSDREWIGTNTDVDGFIYPLKSIDLKSKKSVLIGSGGAARSVIQGLINLNFSKISIISRNKISLNELINQFKNQIHIEGFHNTDRQTFDLLEDTDLIVNTTPVGMNKNGKECNLLPFGETFWRSVQSKTIVYDLIYNPSPTPLLKLCKRRGCLTIDGIQMLVAQGAKSLSFWTDGLEVPYDIMFDAIKTYL